MKEPKLLLFDIDGTLISTHGIPRRAMSRVLMNRYEQFRYDDHFNFSGRTDWEIVEHLLQFDRRKVNEAVVSEILHDFTLELQTEINNGKKPLIHPGVESLLSRLDNDEMAYLGLVTGNIARGAQIKLAAAGLYDYFPVGAFGDDAKMRRDLPVIAIKRAASLYGLSFKNENIWIIGDSIYDIDCARANDLRSLAVCTGWTSREELNAEKPEFLFNNLSDLDAVLDILING